jgi:hypothetical protein
LLFKVHFASVHVLTRHQPDWTQANDQTPQRSPPKLGFGDCLRPVIGSVNFCSAEAHPVMSMIRTGNELGFKDFNEFTVEV